MTNDHQYARASAWAVEAVQQFADAAYQVGLTKPSVIRTLVEALDIGDKPAIELEFSKAQEAIDFKQDPSQRCKDTCPTYEALGRTRPCTSQCPWYRTRMAGADVMKAARLWVETQHAVGLTSEAVTQTLSRMTADWVGLCLVPAMAPGETDTAEEVLRSWSSKP